MDMQNFQQWLKDRGATGLVVDGLPGPATRAAILQVFSNRSAPAASVADIQACADQIGVPLRNLQAVAFVESGGGGFDDQGRPKILFERHWFHRLSKGRWSPSPFSQAKGGGYSESSWDKLASAACKDVLSAFGSASWGKFQIMGFHANALGYASALEFAYGVTRSEKAHYDAFARFIKVNRLDDEVRAVSENPETCRPFAAGFNGAGYRQFDYHTKIAKAYQRFG